MKHPSLNLLIIVILFFSFKGISQNTNNVGMTFNTSGNDATGSSGTVAYSIGQVFYTYIGESVYNVAQGIQQGVVDQTLGTEDNVVSTTEVVIFPNPTTDFVNLNMKGDEFENELRSYRLYDFQGRLLQQNTINQAETQISLSNLIPSVYLLQVNVNDKVLKTFKIIKK